MKSVVGGVLLIILIISFPFSSSFDFRESVGNKSEQEESTTQKTSETQPDDQFFGHRLDNFDDIPVNPDWYQKYWIDEKYYERGGPVYLMLADRVVLDKKVMKSGYWYKHGKEKKALFLYITHRFYDTINENISPSANTDSLKLLTAQQALVDYADFIKYINDEHSLPSDTKWIVFGSSYAGSLAAWLRTSFPDLVHAAVASSAPVLAKMDIPEYLINVGNTLAEYSTKCKNDISLANKDLDKKVRSPKGRKEIGEIFRLCEPLNGDSMNKSFFAYNTVKYISDVVLHDLELAKVKKICDKMLENAATKKPIHRYAAVIHMLMHEQKKKCLPTNLHAHVQFLQSDVKSNALASGRMWLYQQCTEFGWFPTSPLKSSVFSKNVNLNYFLDLCYEVFRLQIDKHSVSAAVDNTNKVFKGLTLNTSRTLFIHGDADPWKFSQITSTKNNQNLDIITIKKGSHCSDIYYADTDKKEIVNAIKKIEEKLNSYLKQ